MAVEKLFKYLLNSSLALLVFLLSIGVTYRIISCPKIENHKSCCALDKITCCTFEITDNCCYEETLEIQFDFDVPVEKEQESPNFLLAFTYTLHQLIEGEKQIQKLAWTNNLPPPKTLSLQLSILQMLKNLTFAHSAIDMSFLSSIKSYYSK